MTDTLSPTLDADAMQYAAEPGFTENKALRLEHAARVADAKRLARTAEDAECIELEAKLAATREKLARLEAKDGAPITPTEDTAA